MADAGCAGILVADTFCGPMAALPGEGQLLAVGPMPSKAGGCAADVALDLVKQGLSVDVAGCLGRDTGARVLETAFQAQGVGTAQLVTTAEFATSQTVILLVTGQDRRYIHNFGANQAFTVAHISRDWIRTLKVFYFGGLFAMPGIRTDELAELLQFCRRHGVLTVVDVVIPQNATGRPDLRGLLPHIDYFLPNDAEAERLTGESEPRRQLQALLAAGARTVVITRGGQGVVAVNGTTLWECGAYPVRVLDPSGSGDAFAAGIVAGALRGWDLPRILPYASALGASATRAVGTTDGVFTAAEAEVFVRAQPLTVRQATL